MSKPEDKPLTWQQQLSNTLTDLQNRTDSGDGSGASRDKAFTEIVQSLHAATIEALPETKELKLPANYTPHMAYRQAIDQMKASIDRLYGVKK
jgi:hypothetical protein